MRLLKTHSHTSERPGYEARKNAKKVIEGNADTIRRQTIRQNLPRTASVAGGARRKRRYGKTNHRQNPPAYRRRGGGGETKNGELKDNTGAKTRKTKVKTLPQATIVAGGARQEAKTNTKWKGGITHSPARGGRCLAENAYQKRKQNNLHHKGKKTKHTVLCYCVSSQLTLAAPRLGAEEGVGRTTKKNEHEKPTVPCLCLAARLPRPWPRTEWGGRRDGRKANRRAKGTTPGPALSEGSVGQEKYKTHEPSGPAQSRKRHSKP